MPRPKSRASLVPIKSSTPIYADGKENKTTPPKTATPYWKALKIDGREPSPRETRSASKAKKNQCLVMCFSPPDQKANAEREQRILEGKENLRARKIAEARESGQLMVFSPANAKKQKLRHSNSSINRKLAFTMDLSPDPKPSELTIMKEKLFGVECKLLETEEALRQAQLLCTDLESQLQKNMRDSEQEHQKLVDAMVIQEEKNCTLRKDLEILKEQLKEASEEHKQDKHKMTMKEQTIHDLSSVLQKTSEREQALEIQYTQLKNEHVLNQKRAHSYAEEECVAMKAARDSAAATAVELQDQLKLMKEKLSSKEHELSINNEMLHTERKKHELNQLALEQQLSALVFKNDELEKGKVDLEQKLCSMEKELGEAKETNADLEVELQTLRSTFNELKQRNDQTEESVKSLNMKLNSSKRNAEVNIARSDKACEELLSAQSLIKILKGDLEVATTKLHLLEQERSKEKEILLTFNTREEALRCKLALIDDVRRKLHNKVLALSGNIRVFVRVRPVIDQDNEDHISGNSVNNRGVKRKHPHEHDSISDIPFSFPDLFERGQQSNSFSTVNGPFCEDDITKQAIVAIEPYKDRGGLKNRQKKWKFDFDHVFSPNHKQVDIWNASEPLVQSVIDGYNVCIFAYGQTGSGKTYTMIGGPGNDNKGIVFRAVEKIFQAKKELEASQSSISVKLSVELLEIYNENIRDLLARNNRQDTLRIVSSDVIGNVCATVEKEEDVYEILSFASSNRCVKATNSNLESSRSHMLFTIHFVTSHNNEIKRVGKLHICDLAGSERLDKSGCHMMSDGSLLKETQNINKSLMCLSTVIEKLQVKDSHIPFRDSKLTMLLQNSLGGDSKTLAIVCCNPLPDHFNESMSSIRFANKVSRVELKATAKVSY